MIARRLTITATKFAELATTCKKSGTRHNPANMAQQMILKRAS
jgi:hypothetical protein